MKDDGTLHTPKMRKGRAIRRGTGGLPHRTDHRLVTRNGARFEADVDAQGNHADTFDSGKLSYWGHVGTGLESCSPSSWRHKSRQGKSRKSSNRASGTRRWGGIRTRRF